MQEQSVNLDKLIPRVGIQQMNLWLAQVALEEAQERIRELEAQLARVLPVMDAPSAEVGPIGTIRGIVRDNSNSDTTEIPAAT